MEANPKVLLANRNAETANGFSLYKIMKRFVLNLVGLQVPKLRSPSRRMATTSRLLATKRTVWSPIWRLEIFGSF